jgi:hypothetical protein
MNLVTGSIRRPAAALLILATALLTACASPEPTPPKSAPSKPNSGDANSPADQKKAADKDPLHLTMANLRGHQEVFDNGWFIVTSSRDALHYAHEHSIVSSGDALAEAQKDMAARTSGVPSAIGQGLSAGADQAVALHQSGRTQSAALTRYTDALAKRQKDYGLEQLGRSWDFVTGGIYYGKRTPEHYAALKQTWSDHYGNMKADWSDVEAFNQRLRDRMRPRIEAQWDGAWHQAGQDFNAHYEESGQEPNSLVALGDVFAGYVKALFVGVVEPSGRAAVQGSATAARGATYVFTPVADSVYVAGNVVEATGLSVYYVGATSIDVMAPTVEAGFLTGLGLLSLGSSSATYLGGQGLGLANQVAMTAAGGVVGGAESVAQAGAAAGQYVALVTYDVGKAGTRVVINQAESGVVLGYNALTQVPVQLGMGVLTGAIFLAYDGPRLVLMKVTEKPAPPGKTTDSPHLKELPVGTVVDMKKLKSRDDVDAEVLTDDPEVTHKVLEHVQDDTREP